MISLIYSNPCKLFHCTSLHFTPLDFLAHIHESYTKADTRLLEVASTSADAMPHRIPFTHLLATSTVPSTLCCDNPEHQIWRLPYKIALKADEQNACLLLRLPAEIRNQIYAYAMTPNFGQTASDENDATDPLTSLAAAASTAPSKSLLLTCGRVYNEAREMFTAAQRRFWSSHIFTIELKFGDNVSRLPILRKEAIELMPTIFVYVRVKNTNRGFIFLEDGEIGLHARLWAIRNISMNCSIAEHLLMKQSQVSGLAKWEQLDALLRQCARLLRTRMRLRQLCEEADEHQIKRVTRWNDFTERVFEEHS